MKKLFITIAFIFSLVTLFGCGDKNSSSDDFDFPDTEIATDDYSADPGDVSSTDSVTNYESILLSDQSGVETKQIGNDSVGYIDVPADMKTEELNDTEISVYNDLSIVAVTLLRDSGNSIDDNLEHVKKYMGESAEVKQTSLEVNGESYKAYVVISNKKNECLYEATTVINNLSYFFYSSSASLDEAEQNLSIAFKNFTPTNQ